MIDAFISVHDQELILRLEKNNIFRNLANYRYLFLGMRPVDKLEGLSDKIILVRDLPVNIEDKKCLYDYTGQLALAHNPALVRSEFVVIVHYDCLIFENFMREIENAFNKDKNAFICFQPHLLTCNYFLNDVFAKSTIQACKDVYNLDLFKTTYELVTNGDKYWQGGGSFSCSYENLKKFVEFNEPLLPCILQDPMAAHNIERTVKFFCVKNKLTEVFLPNVMEHIYNSSHDQSYQPDEMKAAIKQRFEAYINGDLFVENKDKFIEKIFSVKKINNRKVLTLLGVKIKLKGR